MLILFFFLFFFDWMQCFEIVEDICQSHSYFFNSSASSWMSQILTSFIVPSIFSFNFLSKTCKHSNFQRHIIWNSLLPFAFSFFQKALELTNINSSERSSRTFFLNHLPNFVWHLFAEFIETHLSFARFGGFMNWRTLYSAVKCSDILLRK